MVDITPTPATGGNQTQETAQETLEGNRLESETLGEPGQKALRDERRARREAEKALNELQKRLQTFEDANKTELEKATERATTAEAEAATVRKALAEVTLRQAVDAQAVKAGALDLDTVWALTRDTITLDETGKPAGVNEAIADLTKTKGFLFRAPSAGFTDLTGANLNQTPLNGDPLTESLTRLLS